MIERRRIELAVLDALEQTGASKSVVDTSMPTSALGLTEVEYEDLAEDLGAELGVSLDAASLRSARTVQDMVDQIVDLEKSSSP